MWKNLINEENYEETEQFKSLDPIGTRRPSQRRKDIVLTLKRRHVPAGAVQFFKPSYIMGHICYLRGAESSE